MASNPLPPIVNRISREIYNTGRVRGMWNKEDIPWGMCETYFVASLPDALAMIRAIRGHGLGRKSDYLANWSDRFPVAVLGDWPLILAEILARTDISLKLRN